MPDQQWAPRVRLRRAVTLVGLAALVAAALTGCGSAASSGASGGALRIVASTSVYADIARQVAGKHATVTSFISDPSADPHSYQATAQDQLDLARSDFVIENGGGYDNFMNAMRASSPNKKAAVLDVVAISGKSTAEQGFNEHVWYDFPTVRLLVGKLADTLAAKDAADAAEFRSNASRFDDELAKLIATEQGLSAIARGAGVAITEPVPLYLLQACGLVNETPVAFSSAVEAGSDVPPRVLAGTLTLFTTHQVRLLAYNSQTTGPSTDAVVSAAKADGIPAVPFTETLPQGSSYLSWMGGNLSAVAKALGR